MRITSQIDQEIQTFKMVFNRNNGEEFDHYDTIKRINLHKSSKFYDCDDSDALFWSLGIPRKPKFAKKLNFDPKHFRPVAMGDKNFYQGWIMNMRFKKWVEDTGFAIDLDDLADACADYGSCVMKLVPAKDQDEENGKVTKYDLKECDLTKIYFDTTKRPVNESPLIEEHEFTKYELKRKKQWLAYAKKNGWSFKDIWDKAEKVSVSDKDGEDSNYVNNIIEKIKVYERVGEYEIEQKGEEKQHCVKMKEEEPVYLHGFYCGSGDDECILWEEEIEKEDCHYYDFHIDKYEDRFLGYGVYERLFGQQKQINELINYNREATAVASLLLLYSKDKKMQNSNVIQEAQSGQILESKLEQQTIDNRFINEFLKQLETIEFKADQLCMVPDINDDAVRGKILTMNEITSTFRISRNRLFQRMFGIMKDKLMESHIRDWNREDIIEISNDQVDIEVFDALMIKFKINQFIAKEWKAGRNPSPQDKERYTRSLVENWDREGRQIPGMKKFFNFKYGFKIDPFGELEDKEKKSQARQWAVGIMSANPAVANHPYVMQELEDAGVPPHKLSLGQMAAVNENSISTPELNAPKQDAILSKVKDE